MYGARDELESTTLDIVTISTQPPRIQKFLFRGVQIFQQNCLRGPNIFGLGELKMGVQFSCDKPTI